jgi:hypothetical protein
MSVNCLSIVDVWLGVIIATDGTLLAATLFMALSTAHISTRAHQQSQWVAFCVYNIALVTVVILLVTLLITFGDLSFFIVIKSLAIIYILLLVPGVLYLRFLSSFFKTRTFGSNTAGFRSGKDGPIQLPQSSPVNSITGLSPFPDRPWEAKAVASFTAGSSRSRDDPYGIGSANGGTYSSSSRTPNGSDSRRFASRPGTVREEGDIHDEHHDDNDIGLSITDDTQFKRY